jgi:hypothetical protein
MTGEYMKRISKISAVLMALTLVFPALAQGADTYDEQHLATSAPAKNFQGYLLQDSAEITRFNSGLISFKVNAAQGVESITACSSLAQLGCEFSAKQFYRAILPKCDSVNTVDCITTIFAKTDDGKELDVQPAGIFADKGKYDFQGDPTQNLPTGGGAILIKIPAVPHAGGDLYLVKSEMVGVRDTRNSPTAKFLMQRMQTGIFAVAIEKGAFGFNSMSTDPKQYPTVDWTVGAPVGNPPETGRCVMTSETECAKGFPLPQNVAFGLQFRMNNKLDGWLHGRMKAPAITIENEAAGTQLLTVKANAIKVPLVDVWVNNDAMPAGLKNYYVGVPSYGSTTFGTKEQPLSEIALRRDGNAFNDANTMKEFVNWLPVIGDKAQGMPTAWMLKTMISFGDTNQNPCFAKGNGFAGVVSTNAAQYLDGPPSFDKNEGVLDYKVAAPHLTSSGDVFKGTYDLVMSSAVARCLYGFSQAPIGATISIVSDTGEPNIATTLVREKDGFLNLAAYNFTFSSPTVRVKLTQEKVIPKASVTVPAKKTSITCVKGKTSKKVTAVNPACPKGYKKK